MKANTPGKMSLALVLLGLCISTPLFATDYPRIITVDGLQNTSPSNWYGTDYRICQDVSCTSYYHTNQPLASSPWGGVVKKYHFVPGFYRITVADGAVNAYGSGPEWTWFLQIYVEGNDNGYLLGRYQFYSTPEEALAGNIDRSRLIEIDTPGDVWFWFADTYSGDNVGFMTATVDRFSAGDCIEMGSKRCTDLQGRAVSDCLLEVIRNCRDRFGH